MILQRRLVYMMFGGLLALVLAFGAFATFAQTDDGADGTTPDAETDDTTTERPGRFDFGGPGPRGFAGPEKMGAGNALLADALGITVDELAAAQDAARTAAIEQAVANGLITQEQADQLLANERGFRGRLPLHGNMDGEALLADALGISVEELQAAQADAMNARLAQMVEDGVITQEQADMMQAQKAVRDYVDTEALADTVQSFFADAIEQALADGVITQEQADTMLSNLEEMGPRPFGGPGFDGPRGPRGGHGHGHVPGGFGGFAPDSLPSADSGA